MKREERIVIDNEGNTIPIVVEEVNGVHEISIDGTVWVRTENMLHATVLFSMMLDHITEYMNYEIK